MRVFLIFVGLWLLINVPVGIVVGTYLAMGYSEDKKEVK